LSLYFDRWRYQFRNSCWQIIHIGNSLWLKIFKLNMLGYKWNLLLNLYFLRFIRKDILRFHVLLDLADNTFVELGLFLFLLIGRSSLYPWAFVTLNIIDSFLFCGELFLFSSSFLTFLDFEISFLVHLFYRNAQDNLLILFKFLRKFYDLIWNVFIYGFLFILFVLWTINYFVLWLKPTMLSIILFQRSKI
jgi:hypothetical protein